jgi:hypothetical protein
MPYEAKVLAHSVSLNHDAPPLFTMQLRYPKFLHAEELTHRVLSTSPEMIETVSIPDGFMYDRNLSRNASSSRAIPVPQLIGDIRRDPAEPLFWVSAKPACRRMKSWTRPPSALRRIPGGPTARCDRTRRKTVYCRATAKDKYAAGYPGSS